jgi:hypothetical protein
VTAENAGETRKRLSKPALTVCAQNLVQHFSLLILKYGMIKKTTPRYALRKTDWWQEFATKWNYSWGN